MRSIRFRVGLGMALITLLAVLVTAAVQFSSMRAYLLGAERARLISYLPQLEAELNRSRPGATPVVAIRKLPRTVDVRVLQGRRVLATTPNFPPLPARLPLGFRKEAHHDVLVATVSFRGQVAQAQLASDVLGIVNPLRVYLHSLAWILPLTTALAGLLGFLLGQRLLAPLRQLGLAVEAVGARGNWRQALPFTAAPNEVGSVARILQDSFSLVADVREREELFTRAAAHDLRSPLTALKTRLQGALSGPRQEAELREDIREALTDVERMRSLSDHLLLLAQGLRNVQLRPLDLAELAGGVVDLEREMLPDAPIEFESGGPQVILGDNLLLRQLLKNLIQNALRYGGLPIMVSVSQREGQVRLSVHDAGASRNNPTPAPGGSGVGLKLARRIAEAHHAELRVLDGQQGGWTVEVLFPTQRGGGGALS